MPDRIVTGTYMIASAITGGEVYIKNAFKEHVSVLIGKLKDGGCQVYEKNGGLVVKGTERLSSSHIIETMPYPGFPTDLQSPMMALQTVARGTCVLVENVFENRFRLAGELKKMGADITVKDRMAIIRGVDELTGTTVYTHDLRGLARHLFLPDCGLPELRLLKMKDLLSGAIFNWRSSCANLAEILQ